LIARREALQREAAAPINVFGFLRHLPISLFVTGLVAA
jgi:hypothetical protein